MDMRIVETGHNESAVQVDELRFWSCQLSKLAAHPDLSDAAVADSKCLRTIADIRPPESGVNSAALHLEAADIVPINRSVVEDRVRSFGVLVGSKHQ